MNVVDFPLVFWRYSREYLDTFRFWECEDEKSLLNLTIKSLEDKNLCTWIEKLLSRPDGYCQDIVNKPASSDHLRALHYISHLLINRVIMHHTGTKGGISVYAKEFKHSSINYIKNQTLEDLQILKRDNQNNYKTILKSNSSKPYELALDYKNRAQIDLEQEKKKARKIAQKLAIDIAKENKNEKKAYFIAIDMMKRKDYDDLLEVHLPGRSIGIHVAPFLLVDDEYSSTIFSSLSKFDQDIKELCLKRKINININLSLQNHTFHKLDNMIFETLTVQDMKNFDDTYELDIESSPDHPMISLETRKYFKELINSEKKDIDWAYIPKGKTQVLEEKLSLIDGWIALKQNDNYPWWHEDNKQVLILNPNFPHHHKKLLSYLEKEDIFIERLNIDSKDNLNRSGELRYFFLIVP